jgi:hypothetical protein
MNITNIILIFLPAPVIIQRVYGFIYIILHIVQGVLYRITPCIILFRIVVAIVAIAVPLIVVVITTNHVLHIVHSVTNDLRRSYCWSQQIAVN